MYSVAPKIYIDSLVAGYKGDNPVISAGFDYRDVQFHFPVLFPNYSAMLASYLNLMSLDCAHRRSFFLLDLI